MFRNINKGLQFNCQVTFLLFNFKVTSFFIINKQKKLEKIHIKMHQMINHSNIRIRMTSKSNQRQNSQKKQKKAILQPNLKKTQIQEKNQDSSSLQRRKSTSKSNKFTVHRTLVPINLNSKQKKLTLSTHTQKKSLKLEQIKKNLGNVPSSFFKQEQHQALQKQNQIQRKRVQSQYMNKPKTLTLQEIKMRFGKTPTSFSKQQSQSIQGQNVQPTFKYHTQFQDLSSEFDPIKFRRQMNSGMGLRASINFTYEKTFDLLINSTASNKKDQSTQTYTFSTEDQRYKQYIRYRLMMAKSFADMEDYFSFIRQMGKKGRKQIQERQAELQKKMDEEPIDYRQNHFYQLLKIVKGKNADFENKIVDIIRDQKQKELIMESTIYKCQNSLQLTFQSIYSLLKVFQTKFKNQNQTKLHSIVNRITKQVKHVENSISASMNKLDNFKDISSPWQEMVRQLRQWNMKNTEFRRLIKNCVRKCLQIPKNCYRLFGNVQTEVYMGTLHPQVSCQQKNRKSFVKSCANCQDTKNKALQIQQQNRYVLPFAKALNQLVRQNDVVFKNELTSKQIPLPVQIQDFYESVYLT